MKALVLLAVLGVAGCSYFDGEPTSLTPVERLSIACSSWASVFDKISTRREFGLASVAEIEAVRHARPLLNPVCTADVPTVSADASLESLELALLRVIQVQETK